MSGQSLLLPVTVLCGLCKNLFRRISIAESCEASEAFNTNDRHREEASIGVYKPFHQSNTALQQSLDLGCQLCTALQYNRNVFERDEVRVATREDHVTLTFKFEPVDHVKTGPNSEEIVHCRHFLLFPDHHKEQHFFRLSHNALSAPYTGDSRVLQLATAWTTRCIFHHPKCGQLEQDQAYPTRLLDIRGNAIRLIRPDIEPTNGGYATLSYRWGKERIPMLTKSTMSKFQSGLDINEIPATFRDAIIITRSLRLGWIWIDCYCIMQPEGGKRSLEFQSEIAQMDKVYSNAGINLCAAGAKSPMDGCFFSREAMKPLCITTNGLNQHFLYDQRFVEKEYDEFHSTAHNPAFGRGWCLQERFLSHRMLHFGRSRIFWECNTIARASDLLPCNYTDPSRRFAPFSFWKEPEVKTTYSVYANNWRRIISEYTNMQLSYPTADKLVACAGVAKRMADLMNDDYIAGFFRRDIVPCLAWTRDLTIDVENRSDVVPRRAKIWRAPSWSWASMDGYVTINPPPRRVDPCTTVVAVDIQLADQTNPYGALKDATITLAGYALEVEVSKKNVKGYDKHESQRLLLQSGPYEGHMEIVFDEPSEYTGPFTLLFTYIWPAADGLGPEYLGDGLVLRKLSRKLFQPSRKFERIGAVHGVVLAQEMFQALRENEFKVV